jgi:hypothetical protein
MKIKSNVKSGGVEPSPFKIFLKPIIIVFGP